MAEAEELNEGQAIVALQQYMLAHKFLGQMDGVMKHYDAMKSAIPDMEKTHADLQAQLDAAKVELDNLKTHHDESVKEMEADFKARKDALTQEQAAEAVRLSSAIDDLRDRKAAKDAEVKKAVADGEAQIEAAAARVKDATDQANAEMAKIGEGVAEKQAEYNALVEKLTALKMSIGQVPA